MKKSQLLWLIISQDTDLQITHLLKKGSEMHCHAPYLHFQFRRKIISRLKTALMFHLNLVDKICLFAVTERDILRV